MREQKKPNSVQIFGESNDLNGSKESASNVVSNIFREVDQNFLSINAGEYIIKEGEEDKKMFFVTSGTFWQLKLNLMGQK